MIRLMIRRVSAAQCLVGGDVWIGCISSVRHAGVEPVGGGMIGYFILRIRQAGLLSFGERGDRR